MFDTILFLMFGTLLYWGVCQMFTVYEPRTLSHKLFFTVKSRLLWLLLAGRYRGRRRMPEESRYKLSGAGIATYIALLPVLLAWYCLVMERVPPWMPSGICWAVYFFAVVFLNIFDELLGSCVNR